MNANGEISNWNNDEELTLSENDVVPKVCNSQGKNKSKRSDRFMSKNNVEVTNDINVGCISDEECSRNNTKSYNRISGRVKGIYKENISDSSHKIYSKTILFLFKVTALITFLLKVGVLRVWKFFKNTILEINGRNIFHNFPLGIFERLCNFRSSSECRRIKIRSYFSSCSNDVVLTKYSWILWTFGAIIMSVFFLGSYQSGPYTSLNIGMENMANLKNLVKYNFYNLPGYECMVSDNCCASNIIAFKRWLYCLVTLTPRVALIGMKVETFDMKIVDESLQNLTDWRLRRSIRRVKALLDELHYKMKITETKQHQIDKLYFALNEVLNLNLSRVIELSNIQKRLYKINDDSIKKYEQLSNDINTLTKFKTDLEESSKDSRNCIKYASRKMSEELEKYINNEMKTDRKFGNRVKGIEKSALKKIGINPANRKFEMTMKDILKIQNNIKNWQTLLRHLENFNKKFSWDVDSLRKYGIDRSESEMARLAKSNSDFLKRMKTQILVFEGNLEQDLSDEKENALHFIATKFKFNSKRIFNDILKEFCPKIRELAKSTISSTLTRSSRIKACGFFSASHDVDIDDRLDPKLNCCFNKSLVSQRIDIALGKFSTDDVGLVDHALKINGGRILESYSSPSLYSDYFEKDQEICESNWLFLNLLMATPTKLINSVNFLNMMSKEPNKCWKFNGHEGSTVIKLASIINVSMVTIDHIYPEITVSKIANDAPKDFEIIILKTPQDKNGLLKGTFTFEDVMNYPIQQFKIKIPSPARYIKFVIKSNHGADVTCVYRIRIHGKVVI